MGIKQQIQLLPAAWALWGAFTDFMKAFLLCWRKEKTASPPKTYSLFLGLIKTAVRFVRVAGGFGAGTWWLLGTDQIIQLLPYTWDYIALHPQLAGLAVLYFVWELAWNYYKHKSIQVAVQSAIKEVTEKAEKLKTILEEPTSEPESVPQADTENPVVQVEPLYPLEETSNATP